MFRIYVKLCHCMTTVIRGWGGLWMVEAKAGNDATHKLQTAEMPYASMALLRMRMATSHVMPRAEGYSWAEQVSRVLACEMGEPAMRA